MPQLDYGSAAIKEAQLQVQYVGRYFVPVSPLIHVCYGLAAVTLLEWIARLAVKIKDRSAIAGTSSG